MNEEVLEPDLTCKQKTKFFFAAHWRGFVCFMCPLILMPILHPIKETMGYQWCAYTLILMAVFWVTECIPLAVTGFIPVFIFPMVGVMSTSAICKSYVNDTVIMFLGSLMLAYSVEQSGLHKRFAYCAIRLIGYSHVKLLLAMGFVTMFVSLWITNTAATTMMVPINFAILKVFEDQGVLQIYDKGNDGELIASDITTCYFCHATFSATIGGVGTLVGTATNLAMKGLYVSAYPGDPEYLSFPKYSAWALPCTLLAEIALWLHMAVFYCGFLRPNSAVAKKCKISALAQQAAKTAIDADWKKLGRITYWEVMVILLFGGAMIGFFCRSPQIFSGWGDEISKHFQISDMKFVRDSALAMLVLFLMMLLPNALNIFKNCTAKFQEELPKGPTSSVLIWSLMNASMPYSFMFLLGGGFALSEAAKVSGLNAKLGETLRGLKGCPNLLVLFLIMVFTIFVTNFASNVAVCNVFAPISMQLATEIGEIPLWYVLAAGVSASYCFMLPVGTPGNLIVQSAAKIPTKKMIIAGFVPTITTLIIVYIGLCFYAPVIWPVLYKETVTETVTETVVTTAVPTTVTEATAVTPEPEETEPPAGDK